MASQKLTLLVVAFLVGAAPPIMAQGGSGAGAGGSASSSSGSSTGTGGASAGGSQSGRPVAIGQLDLPESDRPRCTPQLLPRPTEIRTLDNRSVHRAYRRVLA
jgi:hypothetical protein